MALGFVCVSGREGFSARFGGVICKSETSPRAEHSQCGRIGTFTLQEKIKKCLNLVTLLADIVFLFIRKLKYVREVFYIRL